MLYHISYTAMEPPRGKVHQAKSWKATAGMPSFDPQADLW